MADALSQKEIEARLANLDGWSVDEENMLTKTFAVPTYLEGVAFASTVGTLSEGLDHHPDLLITWRKVKVSYVTHDAGNVLTAKDFEAAEAINNLPYPKE